MATYNVYNGIFQKLKSIFNNDARTSDYEVYGGEYARKKTFPCILIFPAEKNKLTEDNQTGRMKYGGGRQVEYNFNIWAYIRLLELEDSYYSTDVTNSSSGAGIGQILTEVEAVLKDNPTGNDLTDSSNQLWYDMECDNIKIDQRFGKLMNGMIPLTLFRKERD